MAQFVPRGHPRRGYQIAGLKALIASGGVYGLLWEPGTGKTATILDYVSILALKAPSREVRVLVISPLAAVDTWVLQAPEYVADGVTVWAEAIGGSVRERAAALAARGGQPMRNIKRPAREKGPDDSSFVSKSYVAHRDGAGRELKLDGPREDDGQFPRLIIASMGLSSLSSRAELSASRTVADLLLEGVRRFAPDMIVIDESHRIKSNSSNVSQLADRIGKLSNRRAILTGTVMPHSPLDVFAQWRFLAPEAFGKDGRRATWTGFRNRYAVLGGWRGKEVIGFDNLDEMRHIMAKNSMTVRKADVLDLPPVTEAIVPVRLSPAEATAYREMLHSLATTIDTGETVAVPNRLAQLMRLRQITSGYLPDEHGNISTIGTSKVDTIASIVNETLEGEKRVVVFGHFTDELHQLRKRLDIKGTEVLYVDGSTKEAERRELRQRFGSGDPDQRMVFVAQVRTMSLSVNELVTASNVVFGSLPQTRDDYTQAMDRVNRSGQLRPMTMWHALAPNTVDEVILRAHKSRANLEASIIDHIRYAISREDHP